ncbi:hypothetical protein EYC80_003432 [Monilinia laxa]|uniref:LAGLIDADG endonuclease n=1 Tax=Monilinia laxa TaxID=61186 RepID=A0A5N6KDW3_MONLA|nr:hypothetical protein EYC80_003432 [Monilinia laxa]
MNGMKISLQNILNLLIMAGNISAVSWSPSMNDFKLRDFRVLLYTLRLIIDLDLWVTSARMNREKNLFNLTINMNHENYGTVSLSKHMRNVRANKDTGLRDIHLCIT